MKKTFEEKYQEIMEGYRIQMIPNLLEEIRAEICDKYCKYPEQYEVPNPNGSGFDYDSNLIKEHCDKCPISMIG
jgi:hypothetical protein